MSRLCRTRIWLGAFERSKFRDCLVLVLTFARERGDLSPLFTPDLSFNCSRGLTIKRNSHPVDVMPFPVVIFPDPRIWSLSVRPNAVYLILCQFNFLAIDLRLIIGVNEMTRSTNSTLMKPLFPRPHLLRASSVSISFSSLMKFLASVVLPVSLRQIASR